MSTNSPALFAVIDDDNKSRSALGGELKKVVATSGFQGNCLVKSFKTLDDYTKARNSKKTPSPKILVFSESGFEARNIGSRIESIFSIEDKSHTRLVIISANASAEIRINAYKAGAIDFLHKPLEPSEFGFKLSLLIEQIEKREADDNFRHQMSLNLQYLLENRDEMVALVQIMEMSLGASSVSDVCHAIAIGCEEFGLSTSLLAFPSHESPLFFTNCDNVNEEHETLLISDTSQRIVLKGDAAIVSYDNISIMVKPLPEDPVLSGRLLDHMAIIARAADNQLANLYKAFNSISPLEKIDDSIIKDRFEEDNFIRELYTLVEQQNEFITGFRVDLERFAHESGLPQDKLDAFKDLLTENNLALISQNEEILEMVKSLSS